MHLRLKAGRLIDGTGKVTDDAVVVIDGNKITAVGRAAETTMDDARPLVGEDELTILPGMIDLHVHLHGQAEAEEGVRARLLNESDAYQAVILAENAHRTLEAGFTTIRDMGAPNDVNFAIARAVRDGILKHSPRVVPVGTVRMTTTPDGFDVHGIKGDATGRAEARKVARQKIAAGAEIIHVVATGASFGQFGPHTLGLTVEEMQAAIEEAHKLGKRTTAHACGAQGMKNAVVAGTQCIEHGQWLYADEDLVKMMVDRGVAWVPTLMNNPAKLEKMKAAEKTGGRSGLPAYVEERVPDMVAAHRRSFEVAMKQGVITPVGTDCGAPFTPNGTNAKELEFFVNYGATEMQAIEAATRVAAEVLGMSDLLGTVQPGKEADLVLVKGDPLKDIRVLQDLNNIVVVIKAGEIVVDRRQHVAAGHSASAGKTVRRAHG